MAKKRVITRRKGKRRPGRQWTPLLTPALAEAMRCYLISHCPTITKLCDVFSIHRSTFYDWLNEHKDLRDAVKAAREEALERLADKARTSLEKLVEGFKYTETTRELMKDKLVITKRVRKFVAPSEKAIEFALKNVEPEFWQDRQEIEHTGHVPITIINYADSKATGSGDHAPPQLPAPAVPIALTSGDGRGGSEGGGGVAPESGQGQDLD